MKIGTIVLTLTLLGFLTANGNSMKSVGKGQPRRAATMPAAETDKKMEAIGKVMSEERLQLKAIFDQEQLAVERIKNEKKKTTLEKSSALRAISKDYSEKIRTIIRQRKGKIQAALGLME